MYDNMNYCILIYYENKSHHTWIYDVNTISEAMETILNIFKANNYSIDNDPYMKRISHAEILNVKTGKIIKTITNT